MRYIQTILSVLTASAMTVCTFSSSLGSTYTFADSSEEDFEYSFPDEEDLSVWDYTILDSLKGVCDSPCVQINAYEGTRYVITLPAEIEGLPVVSVKGALIENPDYYDSYHVFVPDSIVDFGDNFMGQIQNMNIFTSTGDEYCFYNFSYLSYNMDKPVFCLESCGNRKNIIIPEKVCGYTVEGVFGGCTSSAYSAESIWLPDTIKYIPETSFAFTESLKKIRLPEGIEVIPSEAFAFDNELEEVIFPKSLKFIARDAFDSNTKVDVPKDKIVNNCSAIHSNVSTFNIFDIENMLCYMFTPSFRDNPMKLSLIYDANEEKKSCPDEFMGLPVTNDVSNVPPSDIPVVCIDEDMDMLNPEHFYNNRIQKLIVKSKDITIGYPGFPKSYIEELNFPHSVDLCQGCFGECEHLSSVTFGGENANIFIGRCGFMESKKLEKLIFPKNCAVLDIGSMAFSGTGVRSVDFPDGEVNIGEDAFMYCDSLKEATFGDNVKIDRSAFYNCDSLEKITFKGSAKIDVNAFANCKSLREICLDPSKFINGDCFSNCLALKLINGESPFNEDGSVKEEYTELIENDFRTSADNGIINEYVMNRVKKMVSETVTDDMSDIQKIKALHDKLCGMVYYDSKDIMNNKNHNDASVFLNKSSVCDGYARAMNLLLHEAGITSCYVCNFSHAWVIVTIGGHNFHVDPTWDDGDDIIYDWFMRSDDQIVHDADHSSWRISQPSSMHSFQGKELPVCAEIMGDVNGDSIADARDASAILKAYTMLSAGCETDIDPVLADYDFSGSITAVDASKVLRDYAEGS